MHRRLTMGLVFVFGCGGGGQGAASAVELEPAAAGSAATRRACEPTTDSTFGVASTVYRACAVDREAKALGRRLDTDFRPANVSTTCYRAIVEFVVNEKGQTLPSTARIVRTTDSQYARAVMEAIPHWRFTPASKGGRPVAQAVQIDQWIQAMVRASGQPSPPPPSRPTC